MAHKRKPLEPWQIADAERLRQAWKNHQPHISQARLAVDAGIGETQGSVEQYLNARIPLNLTALLKLCRILGVRPHDISPTLAAQIPLAAASEGIQQALPIYATPAERRDRLLELFDKLRLEQQDDILARIDATARANEAIVRELGPRFRLVPDEKVARHIQPAGKPPSQPPRRKQRNSHD